MRMTFRLLAVASLLVLLVLLAPLPPATATSVAQPAAALTPTPTHRPLIIAHRGASGQAPENTMAAFELAIELGADIIELDVRRSSDGALVVIHDATVNRTTTGDFRGAVADLTLAELKSLDAGSWRGEQFAGEPIPTLDEVLERLGGRTRFLIELKEAGIEADVARAIRDAGVTDSVMMQSFDAKSVGAIAALMPETPAGVLFRAPGLLGRIFLARRVIRRSAAADAAFAAINYRAITKPLVRSIRAAGLGVYAWTVNSAPAMRAIVALGLDGIITNYPETLRGLL
jgi:glycerophosphoryl diester phosphodiesterase